MNPQHRNDADRHGPYVPPARWAPIGERVEREALTDSGIIRLRQTRVRLHLHQADPIDVALLDIQGVVTWDDVALLITNVAPIIVRGDRRIALAAGVVLWGEVLVEAPAEGRT